MVVAQQETVDNLQNPVFGGPLGEGYQTAEYLRVPALPDVELSLHELHSLGNIPLMSSYLVISSSTS